MDVFIAEEAGYQQALYGLSLSYHAKQDRWEELAAKLAHKQGGHNKFLESIMVWILVRAPRYWWSQADTYRMSTKQSESTMHTILRRDLMPEDFEGGISPSMLVNLNSSIYMKDLETLKRNLPESFIQKRMWVMSYKTLQNIYNQRNKHKLVEWRFFCEEVLKQLNHPELIKEGYEVEPYLTTMERFYV